MSILSLCLLVGLAAIGGWLAWGVVVPERRATPRRISPGIERTADHLFRHWDRRD